MLSNDFSCRVCRNMIYYKCTKDKSYAKYIREGSCLKAAPLTKDLKAREGIVKEIGRLGTTMVQNHLTRLEGKICIEK